MGTYQVEDCDHDDTNNDITFHGVECHLLAGFFELFFNSVDFFLMGLILSLDDVSIFEFFEFFIEFFDLGLG